MKKYRQLKTGERVKRGDYVYAWKGSSIMIPAKDLLGCKVQSKDESHFREVKPKKKKADAGKGEK